MIMLDNKGGNSNQQYTKDNYSQVKEEPAVTKEAEVEEVNVEDIPF